LPDNARLHELKALVSVINSKYEMIYHVEGVKFHIKKKKNREGTPIRLKSYCKVTITATTL
jgi:hypothetical protein